MKTARELLIFGASGMLGTALGRAARQQGIPAQSYAEAELDITDREATQDAVARFAARLSHTGARGAIVNAAAYTDVERAEEDVERAFLVNELAAGWMAAEAWRHDIDLAHVSTDFVFDGTKAGPYAESDEPHPLNVYGLSKLAGEEAVLKSHPSALIVRTAWTYGPGGTNFPLKILLRARAATRDGSSPPILKVVADEIGSPTYSIDLAAGLLALLSAGATGPFHLAGGGSCSRFELALETLRLAGFAVPGDIEVQPVESGRFPTKAVRPRNSALDCTKAGSLGVILPEWQEGLTRFVAEL